MDEVDAMDGLKRMRANRGAASPFLGVCYYDPLNDAIDYADEFQSTPPVAIGPDYWGTRRGG